LIIAKILKEEFFICIQQVASIYNNWWIIARQAPKSRSTGPDILGLRAENNEQLVDSANKKDLP